MIRPAVSPGGLAKTLPALSVPPGWWSRLQRVTCRISASAVSAVPASVVKRAPMTTSAGPSAEFR